MAVLCMALAVALSGCTADDAYAAPSIADLPQTATPGSAVTLTLQGLYSTCCDQPSEPQVLTEVTVRLTDNNGEVLDEETVDVADDATASVTLDMPDAAPTYVTVEIDGYDAAGFWVKEAD